VAWKFTGITQPAPPPGALPGDQYVAKDGSSLMGKQPPHAVEHLRIGDFLVNGFLSLFFRKTPPVAGENQVYFDEDVTDAPGTKFLVLEEQHISGDIYRAQAYVADAEKTKVIKDLKGEILTLTSAIATISAVSLEKHSSTIGNGVDTQFTITHDFGTRDVTIQVRETAGTNSAVNVPIVFHENSVQVTFASPPALNQYKITVIG